MARSELPVTGTTGDHDISQQEDVTRPREHAAGLGGVPFLAVTRSAPVSAAGFSEGL